MARIRLFLKEGKTLANGEHPIMLMVAFNGKCTRSTGYSCPSRYWDKKNECVKKGFSNFSIINYEITRMKNECIERRTEFERLQKPYTAQMIISSKKILSAVRNDLNGVISNYIDDKGLEAKTIEKWWVVYRSVVRYCNNEKLIVNEIDESFCRKYARWLESEGLSNGSIRSYLGKIGAICHYAISKGLMSEHPFKTWKYHLDYRESKSELYIHSRTMEIMMQMFLDEVIDRNGKMWSYKDGVIDELMDIHSELYSHYLYVVGFYLCGLAPVDISLYKKTDIRVRDVNGKSYYYFNGHSSKTGIEYRFYIPFGCLESNVLIRTMLMFNNGTEYFLPTLKDFHSKDIKKRVNNLYTYHGEHLVNWFQRINEEIARRNVMNEDNIELINLECRYYSYRHSRIMAEIQKPNVNLLKIATETGKSVTSLHQYITLLGEADLVE